jgi:hypothetical protein
VIHISAVPSQLNNEPSTRYDILISPFYLLLLKAVLNIPIKQRRIQMNRRTAMDKKHDRAVEGQEVSKMEDFIKSGKETGEFARDAYLDSFKMPFSLWEGSIKKLYFYQIGVDILTSQG